MLDTRNILVSTQSIIWLSENGTDDEFFILRDNLLRILSCLSQEICLPETVKVRMSKDERNALILFNPLERNHFALSSIYDIIANVSTLNNGVLYIGKGQFFIQYRDSMAPKGYDANISKGHLEKGQLYFVNKIGTTVIKLETFLEIKLDELFLTVLSQQAYSFPDAEKTFVLSDAPLFRILANYFQNHGLDYRLARFILLEKKSVVLFEVFPLRNSNSYSVPKYVSSHVEGLPHTIVLMEAYTGTSCRVLVQSGYKYPFRLEHIVKAFPLDSLLIFTGSTDLPNLCLAPTPYFVKSKTLMVAQTPNFLKVKLKPKSGDDISSFEIPVKLTRYSGPTPFPSALILQGKEIEWICRLLYRLPSEIFRKYKICIGKDRAVILSERGIIETLPFGILLRRFQDTQLFIPLHTSFIPDLPWAVLSEALELNDDQYTFLTEEIRIDLNQSDFEPLGRAVVMKPNRPRVAIHMRPISTLPKLRWKSPLKSTKAEEEIFLNRETKEEPSWMQAIQHNRGQKSSQPRKKSEMEPIIEEESEDIKALLQEQAKSRYLTGDYLKAALYYAMLEDRHNAARCYQEAAAVFKKIQDRSQGKNQEKNDE